MPDAEPPSSGSAPNTGVSGTRHAVAASQDAPGQASPGQGTPAHGIPSQTAYGQPGRGQGGTRRGRRLRPIRYAHSRSDENAAAAPATQGAADGSGVGSAAPASAAADAASGTVQPGTVLSGTVVTGPRPADGKPAEQQESASPAPGGWASPAPGAWQAPPGQEPEPAGQEAAEPTGPAPAGTGQAGTAGTRVPNEGLGIFGGVPTTEVTDEPGPAAGSAPAGGAEWNRPIGSEPEPSEAPPEEGTEESKPGPFGRLAGMLRGGAPADDDQPRTGIRDLPPDVQLRLWRTRLLIMVIVGAVFAGLTRSWEVALTLAILAGILDTVYRSRNAANYQVAGAHTQSVARRRTTKQLTAARREGYLALDARPIPNSREYIDHLVIGPTGVYAIDSEKWDPKLPVRTLNGKELFIGPESHKDRLRHALWEAQQASEILSGALGTEITVRPALAIYGPKIPWDITTIRNVDVFTGPGLRRYLKRRSRMKHGVPRLSPGEVRAIYDAAARVLPDVAPAAPPQTYTPVG